MKRIHIKEGEVGLWYRHGVLHQILDPGSYKIPGQRTGRDVVELVDVLESIFELDELELDTADESWLVEHGRRADSGRGHHRTQSNQISQGGQIHTGLHLVDCERDGDGQPLFIGRVRLRNSLRLCA